MATDNRLQAAPPGGTQQRSGTGLELVSDLADLTSPWDHGIRNPWC